MGFSKQEYWSDLLCCPPGHCPDPGTELRSPAWGGGGSLSLVPPGKRSQPSGGTNSAGTSISVFQPAELGGRKFLLSKSPCLWYLVNHSLGKLVQTSLSDFELPVDRDLELLFPGSLAPGNLTGNLRINSLGQRLEVPSKASFAQALSWKTHTTKGRELRGWSW